MILDKHDANEGHPEDLVPEDDRIIGVVFKRSLLVFAVFAVVIAAFVVIRGQDEPEEAVIERSTVAAPKVLETDDATAPKLVFTDMTEASGIRFDRENGADGAKLLPETMGGGAAFFDMDGDGDSDLLLVGGKRWGEDREGSESSLRLYRNDGDWVFVDVTEDSGLDVLLQGMGVAVGDVDGDGLVDVYVTAVGSNRLFRNLGSGRFLDVTAEAGVGGGVDAWSSSAGFLDIDNDGRLDLFVANYIEWSPELDRRLHFTLNGTDRAYGPPTQYPGANCVLYHNRGDGRFTDVSAEAGIEVANPSTGAPMGKALATTFADVDGNGAIDIFVANDTVENFLFVNQGDGTFIEQARRWGVATDNNGSATGAMGADAAMPRGDLCLAIAVGNFANEASSLFVQWGPGEDFTDLANITGVGSASRLHLSFGLFFFDADLDGRLDLLQANGHLENEINEVQPSQTFRQAAQLFWNTGRSRQTFIALADGDVGDLARPIVGRGTAFADLDDDGDLDVLIMQPAGSPMVLRNDLNLEHHWLRLRVEGGDGVNRDGIGTQVELEAGGRVQNRLVMPTRSYLSQVELPVTFGLGEATEVDRLLVRWPDGREQTVEVDGIDRTVIVKRVAPSG